jgi:hypothetical protein
MKSGPSSFLYKDPPSKKFTITMGAVGTDVTVAHGLDQSKITGADVFVLDAGGNLTLPSTTDTNWYEIYINATNIVMYTGLNATAIPGQTARVKILYDK